MGLVWVYVCLCGGAWSAVAAGHGVYNGYGNCKHVKLQEKKCFGP
jgi:hypothetical protein